MDSLPAAVWIAACAHRLQRRWRTVDPSELEDVAHALWADEKLRQMNPDEAAQAWLAPVDSGRMSKTGTCPERSGDGP